MSFDVLQEKIREKKNPTVAGLDARIEYVPEYIRKEAFEKYGVGLKGAVEAIWQFNVGLIDALCDIVPAVKPQAAYYENLGWQGMEMLERTIRYAKEKGLFVIADIKRGDIGIPPMLGCAQYTSGKSTAILGGRSQDKIILTNSFEDECAKVLVATDDGSMGHHGFVDALVRQELSENNNYDAVLACGPKPMLRNVAKVAEEFGVPCQVSMEERMGCGVGACLVCACDMADGSRKHVCKDGPVFDSKEVDWNA